MNNPTVAVVVLVLALAASITANIYTATQNTNLNTQLTADQTRIDMTATLSAAQKNITTELDTISQSLIYASKQLSTTGLTGTQAEAILNKLAKNSSFIINAATENLQNTIITVAPANWTNIIGKNVGEQTYLNPNPTSEITPMMTPVVAVQSDIMANIIAAPIFDVNKQLIGTVSIIFNPQTLIATSASTPLEGKPYELIGMQLDGLMIYDSDPDQQWRNMFTDPAYQSFTELLALGHHVADAPSGYGTYNFNLIGSNEVAHKECYWSTIWAFGQQWRLALNHAL